MPDEKLTIEALEERINEIEFAIAVIVTRLDRIERTVFKTIGEDEGKLHLTLTERRAPKRLVRDK